VAAGRRPAAPLPRPVAAQAEGGARPSTEEEAPPPPLMLGLPWPFSKARTRPLARGLACARADSPCGTDIQVRRSVGLTTWSATLTAGGVDGGGGGGACRVGSTTSPTSLEKRRRGGAALRAAMVANGLGVCGDGVVAVAVPFANEESAAVAAPFAEEATAEDDGAAVVSLKPGGTAEDDGPASGFMAASATGTQEDGSGAVPWNGYQGRSVQDSSSPANPSLGQPVPLEHQRRGSLRRDSTVH